MLKNRIDCFILYLFQCCPLKVSLLILISSEGGDTKARSEAYLGIMKFGPHMSLYFHFSSSFPQINIYRCQSWMQALGMEGTEPSIIKKMRVCERHFSETCYSVPKNRAPKVRTLNKNAVPCLTGMQLKSLLVDI